jgi:hypothetical protein
MKFIDRLYSPVKSMEFLIMEDEDERRYLQVRNTTDGREVNILVDMVLKSWVPLLDLYAPEEGV